MVEQARTPQEVGDKAVAKLKDVMHAAPATPDPDHEVAIAELVDDEPGTMVELSPKAVIAQFMRIPIVKIDDAESVQARLNAQRLAATTVEELMAGRKTVAAKDFTYHPFEVRDVHFMESAFDSGLGVYVAADIAERDTGELLTLVTGSPDVVIQLAKLADWKAFPALVQILPSNAPTDGRNPALHLELVARPPQ